MSRQGWSRIVNRAREIVDGYDSLVTLRQLFYRLVAEMLLANTVSNYKQLSDRTAKARRAGEFPDLLDRGRTIHKDASWSSPAEILRAAASSYRRDRTEGQDFSLYLGVEKAGMIVQFEAWFAELGIPVLALGGYSSQSYVDTVAEHVARQARPAVLLYAGDFDPSGEDIDRDFVDRSACWDKVIRVALDAGQVEQYGLPPTPGKVSDSRAGAFVARHGRLVQVELDALEPSTLRGLYEAALADVWETSTYEMVLSREAAERLALTAFVAGWSS